jgi:hypothetical protein
MTMDNMKQTLPDGTTIPSKTQPGQQTLPDGQSIPTNTTANLNPQQQQQQNYQNQPMESKLAGTNMQGQNYSQESKLYNQNQQGNYQPSTNSPNVTEKTLPDGQSIPTAQQNGQTTLPDGQNIPTV